MGAPQFKNIYQCFLEGKKRSHNRKVSSPLLDLLNSQNPLACLLSGTVRPTYEWMMTPAVFPATSPPYDDDGETPEGFHPSHDAAATQTKQIHLKFLKLSVCQAAKKTVRPRRQRRHHRRPALESIQGDFAYCLHFFLGLCPVSCC